MTAGPHAVINLTHVVPVPARAGNEYRIARLIGRLRRRGYRSILVLAPLPDEPVGEAALDAIAAALGETVLVDRDGRVTVRSDDGRIHAAALTPVPGDVGQLLGEDDVPPAGRHWLGIDRAYCHDAAAGVARAVQAAVGPCAFIAQYIWMTRVLPLLDSRALRVVDTHDVYSTKADKVGAFGIGDWFVPPSEEAARLARADLVLAIQPEEREALARLVPARSVVTVGVDFDVAPAPRTDAGGPPAVLYVGSANPMNARGLADFLQFAWPIVRRRVPEAELIVAGRVGATIAGEWPGVRRLGPVDDLGPVYARADAVVNPAVAGTGLKIKCVEALCHGRPLVTWPAGVDGLGPLAAMAIVARDWYAFATRTAEVLAGARDGREWFTAAERRAVAETTSPDAVYREFEAALDRFLGRRVGPGDARLEGA